MSLYWCRKCEKIYDEKTTTRLCDDPKCLDEELVEYTGRRQEGETNGKEEEAQYPAVGVIEGLCLLVCDASLSMSDPAFPDNDLSKLRMVTRAVHRAVVELYRIGMPDEAFIGIIAFGARASLIPDRRDKPFLLSVREIQREFGSDGLNPYLFDVFEKDVTGIGRDRTDITAGLKLARDIYDGALTGDLSGFGRREETRILKNSDVYTPENKQISVPNVRVLLYSDGEHNPEKKTPLVNAFDSVYPSPLMTAFIGDESVSESTKRGAAQMELLANTCPADRVKGFFLINNSEEYAQLRMLFRMASGASGFCPECLKGYVESFGKEDERRPWMTREERGDE